MSLAADTNGAQPRRGTRVRKAPQPFDPSEEANEPAADRPRAANDDSDSDLTDIGSEDDAPAQPAKRKANGTRKATAPAKRRKGAKAAATPADGMPEGLDGFKDDSPFFNALFQPNVALEPLVEDWVHAYQTSVDNPDAEKAAVHELVLFFIRLCGLSSDVEEHEAMDQDGVVDTIERIQDESVQTNAATYPLISRAKGMRPMKANLTTFISHLIETLYLTPCLFDDADTTKHSVALMPLLFTWLHCMSSSPLRPIRHTGTYIALKINSALCKVAAAATHDLGVKQRQKDAEVKKAGTGAAAAKRVKDAEDKVVEAHLRKTKLEEYMSETDTVLFVHRVRDTDPAIRTDCIRELGVWVKRYPDVFLKSSFYSHFIRGTNDSDGPVRLETMKALLGVFTKLAGSSDTSFSLRLAPRLIQIAAQDTDIPVRTNAIAVIAQMAATAQLDDEDEEQHNKVARLIFDAEFKVRKAAAAFVKGYWEERAEQLQNDFNALRDGKKKRAAKIKDDDLERRFQWKALAQLLVETSQSLTSPDDGDEEAGPSKQFEAVTATGYESPATRASAAADALYSQIDLLQDWHALVDYLLLDHSTSETDPWLLTEEEEDFMLEVLITCIRREDEDDEESHKTKELMKVLPRLFTKHQTEGRRIVGILSIPEHMNLSLYLDLRKTAAYESLWDDITKQFLQHTDPTVLSASIRAINTLTANTALEAVNKQKLAELEESLFTSLRDSIDGEDVSAMTISDDQLSSIEAILLRISLLSSSRDIVTVMQDEEGGQSSGWTIVLAFAGRGGLGYKEEAQIVSHAMHIVMVHIAWLFKRFTEADAENAEKVAILRQRRNEALEVFEQFSVRGRTNASEEVRRQAFLAFINMHNLFSGRGEKVHPAAKVAALEMAGDKQHRLGGVFQAAVEHYASDLEEMTREEDEDDEMTRAEKQRAVAFLSVVSSFVSAIRIGVIDVEQAKEPLAHYGRFGPTYDAIVKKLVDVLRDEGIYNREATTVQHVIAEALQASFTTFLDNTDEKEPEATIALARIAATAFVVQGTHFTVLKQIHPDDIYDMHVAALDWLFPKVALLSKQVATVKDKDLKARHNLKRAKVLTYFKPLALLLGPVTGRDALRLRNHLEELVNESTTPNAIRASSGYKTYEKRLVSIAGKDAELKIKPRRTESKKNNKSVEVIEEESDLSDAQDETEEPAKSKSPENVNDSDEDPSTPKASQHATQGSGGDESASQPSTNGIKRTHPDDESLPDLDLDTTAQMLNMSDEIDLAFNDDGDRERSVSVEPDAKRRKTVKKY